jgi:hypothetical protein
LTRNTNIKSGEDENVPATTRSKGGSVGAADKKPSLFGKVLKRRMSR